MKSNQIINLAIFSALVCLGLTGCVSAQPTVEATLPPTSTALPTRLPTNTPAPTATQTPIPTITPTQTLTPLPTPADNMSEASLFAQGKLGDYDYFLTLQFPEDIEGSYYAKVDTNKPYPCEPIADQKNRLFCNGRIPGYDDYFTLDLYDGQTDLKVFSTEFFVPLDIN